MSTLNSEMLEQVNAATFVLFAVMCTVIINYLVWEIISNGYKRYRSRAAVSLLAIFGGETIKAGVIWWVRSRANAGLPTDWIIENQDVIVFVGAILLVVGPLCFIRIWSPARLGEWPWIAAGIVAASLAFGGIVASACAAIFLGILFFFSRNRGHT